jgi:hypothetical protein
VTYKSIQRGEITLDEEFPPQRVTVDEIAGQTPAEKPAATNGRAKAKAEQTPADRRRSRPVPRVRC